MQEEDPKEVKPTELVQPTGLPGRTDKQPGFQKKHDLNEDYDPFDRSNGRQNIDTGKDFPGNDKLIPDHKED